MQNFFPTFVGACAIGLAACGSVTDPNEDVGAVELSLATVPADVSCLRVVANGSRSVTRLLDVTPNAAATVALDRLPAGIVTVDASAFATACSAVNPTSVPTWVAESPVSVRLQAAEVAKVSLKLIRNGRLSVDVDFEAPYWIKRGSQPLDLAVFGDAPYGAIQIADFPNFIASLNADATIAEVVHLGDIKNGSSRCDTPYFQFVLDGFNTVKKPFLYTPGDNEWTDCHRANNGAYDPIERLAVIRSMFFPLPGLSLGVEKKQVLSQATIPGFETYVENQMWVESGAVFSLLHIVGSNNSLLPWYTDDKTGTKMDDPARRTSEVAARTAAALDWLERAFATAKAENAATVVLMMQADMWDGTPLDGFDTIVRKIAALALAFGNPVLLIEGDSHVFKIDNPFAAGDPVHGVTTPVPNITRMVVQGSTTAPLTEWVKLHVDPAATPPFSWTRVAH